MKWRLSLMGGMVGHFSSKESSHFGLTFAEQLCFISWTAEAVEIYVVLYASYKPRLFTILPSVHLFW